MIRYHYAGMFRADTAAARDGLPRASLAALRTRFPAIQAIVEGRRSDGELGFSEIVGQQSVVGHIASFAEGLGQAFDHVLVLGIGGSALGPKMLLEALRPSAWNELNDAQREYYPRLTVVDNVDPATVRGLLDRVDPRRVLVNVVSKSGATAETMAQYLVVRSWLEDAMGAEAARRHIVATTDPAQGALRQIAREEQLATLDIPPNVGGRFSVLSPVGLLPAALVGVDIAALMRGAEAAVERASPAELTSNLPALYAALQWAADAELGARIHVMMPYSDRLRWFTEWFRQLWAESLGKARSCGGELVYAGPTPLGAVGATDQHSQVQLFVEGPHDKTITIVQIDDTAADVEIPVVASAPESIAYLGGHTLGDLLAAECQATQQALRQSGRMVSTVTMPRLDAEHLGQLIMLFQIATVYAGAWYDVNPLDQPGVELGKQLTYGAMGRVGYEPPRPLATDDDCV